MDAYKDALKRKMEEKGGMKKPALEIAIGIGKPQLDQEYADGQIEGDAIDDKKMREENDLAPEANEMVGLEKEEEGMEEEMDPDMHQKILAALADGSEHSGRGPMGLKERAAHGAKQQMLKMKMKKA